VSWEKKWGLGGRGKIDPKKHAEVGIGRLDVDGIEGWSGTSIWQRNERANKGGGR